MGYFSWIDGGIVGAYLLATMIAGVAVRKYVGKVEHFLVAGREMNLYLGIASLAATEFGIVTCMYVAQNGLEKGFSGIVPGITMALAMWVIGRTGFCIKPLRESGVITIPELFERRFGPRIRWAAGVVIVLGGLLNMGVFLRTGGDFLINVCSIGTQGYSLEIMMTLLLVAVAVYTILGGMLSVLVTDYLQFIVMSAGMLITSILILASADIGWSKLVDTVRTHHDVGGFNPFANTDMGWPYVLFNAIQSAATVLTWQTIIQRLLAAKDSKTGRQVYTRTSFFFVCRFTIPAVWGIAALAMLTPEQIGDNSLTAMPRFLATFIPAGLLGLLVAAMLAADMSTDSAYMLTWGSIIYNDILAPVHKGRWPERRGLLVNRAIVAMIGVFLLVYGLWYPLKGNLWDYLTVTGTIYLSSISAMLIACCYWKRANRWGAAGAIIVGAVIPIAYLVVEQLVTKHHQLPAIKAYIMHPNAPHYAGIAAFVLAGAAMVVGSYLMPPDADSRRQGEMS